MDLKFFHQNTESNFHKCLESSDPVVEKIIELERLFEDSFRILGKGSTYIESFFLHRSRSLFLSAVKIGFGGQSGDVYPLLRTMLENALYAWYLHKDPNRFLVWIQRMDDENSRSKMRNSFSYGKIISEFEKDWPVLAKAIKETYEFHIDNGAHPNVFSVIAGMKMHESVESTLVNCPLIHAWDGNTFQLALMEIARAGVGVLEIYRIIAPEKFAGFDLRIKAIMEGL